MPDDRYRGSSLVDWVGETGRKKIRAATCTVVGCGALGSASSNLLVRCGFGTVKIVDRDFVEPSNLERQAIFTEEDAHQMKPKALAAADRLAEVNSEVAILAEVADLTPRNAEDIVGDANIVIDGSDNLETRYLINDVCVKKHIPWVHGACLAATGICFNVLPDGPCFRCVYRDAPGPGRVPTCETEGILPSIAQTIGALQVSEAIKIVCGSNNAARDLIHIDLTSPTLEKVRIERSAECPTCAEHNFEYLKRKKSEMGLTLCGRNAVQITPRPEVKMDLLSLEKKLEKVGEVSYKGFLLCFQKGDHELVVFPDGRTMVKGTKNVSVARSLYSKYIGS
jgi:adenylyltransferase/sulfurtransferase